MANTKIISTPVTNYANSTISPFAGSLVRDTFNNLDFYVDLSRNGNDAVPQAVVMLSTGMYQQRSTSGGLGGTVRGDELDLPYIFPYRFTMNRRAGTLSPENFDYECTDCSNFPANGTIVSGIGRYSINQMLDNYLLEHWQGEPFLPGYGWDDPILKWIDENGVEHTVTNPTYSPPLFPLEPGPGVDSPWLPWNPRQEFDGWDNVCGWYLPGYTVKNPSFPEDNPTLPVPSTDPVSEGVCPTYISDCNRRLKTICEVCNAYGWDSQQCKDAVGPVTITITQTGEEPRECSDWEECVRDFFRDSCFNDKCPTRIYRHKDHWWLESPSGRLWLLGKYWQQSSDPTDSRDDLFWIPYVPGMGIPVSLRDCRVQLYQTPLERTGQVYPGHRPTDDFPFFPGEPSEGIPVNPFGGQNYKEIQEWLDDPDGPPRGFRNADQDDCKALNPIRKPVYPPSR